MTLRDQFFLHAQRIGFGEDSQRHAGLGRRVFDHGAQALRRGVDLGFQLEPAPVMAEAHLLRELLSNLIHNALEYGAPTDGSEARITVRTRVDGEWSCLEVEDNGPGVAPAERARVLERFQRGRGAQAGGSGLGLAIVRDIVNHHDGRLELLDAQEGAGRGLENRFGGRGEHDLGA